MRNSIRFTIRALGFLTLLIWNVGHADEERWKFLISGTDGVPISYDTQTFNSDRESVGTWIRNRTKEGGQALHGVRVQCSGSVSYFHQRIYAGDGRLLESNDASPVLVVVAIPGSTQEKFRDALCAKRPAWQRALSK